MLVRYDMDIAQYNSKVKVWFLQYFWLKYICKQHPLITLRCWSSSDDTAPNASLTASLLLSSPLKIETIVLQLQQVCKQHILTITLLFFICQKIFLKIELLKVYIFCVQFQCTLSILSLLFHCRFDMLGTIWYYLKHLTLLLFTYWGLVFCFVIIRLGVCCVSILVKKFCCPAVSALQ